MKYWMSMKKSQKIKSPRKSNPPQYLWGCFEGVFVPDLTRLGMREGVFVPDLTRSGARVRGLGLVWTSGPTRSERDQHQTRSRTRHWNLTRLVSYVLLTSLILRRMVPVTYLFKVFFFFGERTWVKEFAFAAWHRIAPDRWLREQHGRLDMCFFVSGERVLPSLPWMWASIRLDSEARLLLSQVVDRVGRIEVPPPLAAAFIYMYRLTGGSISRLLLKRATAKLFYSSFLLFLEQQGEHEYYTLTKKKHWPPPPGILPQISQ